MGGGESWEDIMKRGRERIWCFIRLRECPVYIHTHVPPSLSHRRVWNRWVCVCVFHWHFFFRNNELTYKNMEIIPLYASSVFHGRVQFMIHNMLLYLFYF